MEDKNGSATKPKPSEPVGELKIIYFTSSLTIFGKIHKKSLDENI